MAAERLARAGRHVVLIDEKLAWEKPCGGGITPKAILRYPFLAEASVAPNWVSACEMISPAGRRVVFPLRQKIAVFSRRVLNQLMLDRAQAAGADICQDRVTAIGGQAGNWRLQTRDGLAITAAHIILAGGARNPFRAQFAPAFAAHEMMISTGYFLPGSSDRMKIRFVSGLEGYLWTFPRRDHFSAGIAGKLNDRRSTAELRRLLDEFLVQEGFSLTGAEFFAHLIPSPAAGTLRQSTFCGDGWTMVGDAAGLVDPITGEGLYYAFRSAELAVEALLADRPNSYSALISKELLPELSAAAGYAASFYHGSLLGQPILERMVQLVSYSVRFREIMSDLFTGAQSYATLKRRCYRQLPQVVWQTVKS
jgi:flavin-dependent dehydrogenase